MDYQHFKESFVDSITQSVDSYVGQKCTKKLEQVDKVNGRQDALIIIPDGSSMGTTMYLKPYYEEYCNGKSEKQLLDRALETIKKGIKDTPAFDLDMIRDYEKVKGMLSVDVVSAMKNKELLKNVPHQIIEDLAVVYRINLTFSDKEEGTILITDGLLKGYGIAPEQLHVDAVHNAAIIKPAQIANLGQVVYEAASQSGIDGLEGMEEAEIEGVFVATVPDKTRGAGVLVYENFLEDAAKQIGGDFYVLPSSLHEVILVKEHEDIQTAELRMMVAMVNNNEVMPEDILTYSVYHYDSNNRIFELGEKYEARRMKELAAGKVTKESVLKDLKEKQSCVDSRTSASKEVKKTVPRFQSGEVL